MSLSIVQVFDRVPAFHPEGWQRAPMEVFE